jgi:hypothetical protein
VFSGSVFGEQEAVVIGVKPFDLPGVTHYDVTVLIPDRPLEQARLGTEGVPEGIQPGDHVMAMRAAASTSAADPAFPLPEVGM